MSSLSSQRCEACRADAPQVTSEERDAFLVELPDWEVTEVDGINRLERRFRFHNFVQAQRFTNEVGDLAEEQGHHPALLLEYGKVTVHWWTHKINGLHRNDFIMAARTDSLYKG